jgi:Protein of unknown function (DUF2924)
MNKSIIRQILDLENQSASELRELYTSIMTKPASPAANKEYLKPRIAYRLQELAFGGLEDETKNRLLKIADGASTGSLKRQSDFMAGTKLCREWQGVMHEVMILKDCFEYQGQKFGSLSSIAKKITGTKWNGPKFFKLRSE